MVIEKVASGIRARMSADSFTDEDMARAAIETLADSVTIEMGVALERALSEGDGGRDLGGGYKLRALSAAIRAALSEDKIGRAHV